MNGNKVYYGSSGCDVAGRVDGDKVYCKTSFSTSAVAIVVALELAAESWNLRMLEHQKVHRGFQMDEGQKPDTAQLHDQHSLGLRAQAQVSGEQTPVGFSIASLERQLILDAQRLQQALWRCARRGIRRLGIMVVRKLTEYRSSLRAQVGLRLVTRIVRTIT